MEQTIHLVGMSGSLRKNSLNTHLLQAVRDVLPEGVTFEMAAISGLPLYDADLDIPAASQRPEAVTLLRETLSRADGILIASPEYNYSIPGGLKNAIDWASRGADSPLLGKAVAVMGATPGLWGTVRMQLAFHPIFQFLDMKPVQKPEVLVSLAHQKFDEHGRLTDEKTIELIRQKVQAIKILIVELRAGKSLH